MDSTNRLLVFSRDEVSGSKLLLALIQWMYDTRAGTLRSFMPVLYGTRWLLHCRHHDCILGRKTGKHSTSHKCFLWSGNQTPCQNPHVCLFLTEPNCIKWPPKLPEKLGNKVCSWPYCYITQSWGSVNMEEVGNRCHVDNSLCVSQGTKLIHLKFLICKMYVE